MTKNQEFVINDRENGYSVEVRRNLYFTLRDADGNRVFGWTTLCAGRGDAERIAREALDAHRSLTVG